MYVYSLVNKGEQMPFYIGITNNPLRRLKQHQHSHKHDSITKPENINMNILIDTGDNEHSLKLAEEIEKGLIQYFTTYPCGTNKVIDVKSCFEGKFKDYTSKPRSKKHEKKVEQITQIISNNIFVSKEELSEQTGISISSINYSVKKIYGVTLTVFLERIRNNWYQKHQNENIQIKFI